MTTEKIYTVSEVIDSLVELSGQSIKVRGRLRVGQEDHSIQDVSETVRSSGNQPRLWVYYHHATLGTRQKDLPKFDGLEVIATGVPDISRKGHLRGFPGSITIRHLEIEGA